MSGMGTEAKRKPRWVIKLGSSLLTEDGLGLARNAIADWAAQMQQLRNQGIDVVIVSSGSVAEGCSRLGWQQRPRDLYKLQAAAAVGQMGLVQAWESQFQSDGAHTALVLLIEDDVRNRQRYLNARKTLNALLAYDVVPVVNENDTVANDELRFGDNDSLAALVANIIYADRLVIMTDQQGLFDADPRIDARASLIEKGKSSDDSLLEKAGEGSGVLGRGGMRTKVLAARQAAISGTDTYIVSGRAENVLLRLHAGEAIGTHLAADRKPALARKQWIAGNANTRGKLWLDQGAVKVISESGKSLLPVGVTRCEGQFSVGDVVSCLSPDGKEIARGLVAMPTEEVIQVLGKTREQISDTNVQPRDAELIHRDNLVLL